MVGTPVVSFMLSYSNAIIDPDFAESLALWRLDGLRGRQIVR